MNEIAHGDDIPGDITRRPATRRRPVFANGLLPALVMIGGGMDIGSFAPPGFRDDDDTTVADAGYHDYKPTKGLFLHPDGNVGKRQFDPSLAGCVALHAPPAPTHKLSKRRLRRK